MLTIKTFIKLIVLAIVGFIVLDIILFSCKYSLDENFLYHKIYNQPIISNDFAPLKLKPDKIQKFAEQAQKGKENMKNKTVVIAGLARDIEKILNLTKQKIYLISNLFRDYKIVIFENDSSDKTRKLLIEWSDQDKNMILIPCNINANPIDDCQFNVKNMYEYGAVSSTRMEKMAEFRNITLQFVKDNFAHYDYLMTLDMDLKGPIDLEGIATSFANLDWDVMTSNGIASLPGTLGQIFTYYDLLAYIPLDASFETSRKKSIASVIIDYFKFLKFQKGDDIVRVKSGFAGMAFYRMESILNENIKYSCEFGCEHSGLHHSMIKAGFDRIYINPNQIILVGRQGPNLIDALKHFF